MFFHKVYTLLYPSTLKSVVTQMVNHSKLQQLFRGYFERGKTNAATVFFDDSVGNFMAGSTRFELAVSGLTGQRVRPGYTTTPLKGLHKIHGRKAMSSEISKKQKAETAPQRPVSFIRASRPVYSTPEPAMGLTIMQFSWILRAW